VSPWCQFDDHFPDTLGAINAGGEALGAHLMATCWCAAHLSDGEIPDAVAQLYLARFATPDILRRLEAAGLWERTDGGWRLTDFFPANRSRKQVEADRKRASKGGRAKAAKDRAAREASTNASTTDVEAEKPLF
jgi:hypothetical protein